MPQAEGRQSCSHTKDLRVWSGTDTLHSLEPPKHMSRGAWHQGKHPARCLSKHSCRTASAEPQAFIFHHLNELLQVLIQCNY